VLCLMVNYMFVKIIEPCFIMLIQIYLNFSFSSKFLCVVVQCLYPPVVSLPGFFTPLHLILIVGMCDLHYTSWLKRA